ncbi:sulfatase-like hydrolase/transferase [Seonamhaeicola sp.]|uniref:sulfatase-like hydrolase/transferase n=1 Tax=Seonamhaeicola sp. TaxID=1912245 RepID=UPI00262FE35B|nr:sulfatase-like hydrolase/transferase [Seonamhaeicola sp.]
MRRHYVLIIFLCLLAFQGINAQDKAGRLSESKPNIIVILADDLGYKDVGFTGSKEIFTPNLDKLANNGVIFKNGYVTHPFCGPSRAGLVTGRYQARFGLEINLTNSPFDMYNGLPKTEQTFAKRLQKSGYKTGIIGKWHLGGSYGFHPNRRGFDYFYGFVSGGHNYFPELTEKYRPLIGKKGDPLYAANEGTKQPLTRNDKLAEFDEYLTTALSKDAARFIKGSKDQPFCLYLAYNAPHKPLEAPEDVIAKYKHIKDPNRRTYAAMIDVMDQGIGTVVDALKKTGKLENTLIFFLSDNGGHRPDKKGYTFADNGPFKEGKGSMHEGGSHVPFILHWPGGNLKTGEFDGLVSALDIAATAVALGKGDTSGKPLDGKNLIPYLTGEKSGSPHDALFWRIETNKAFAVRTEQAKFLLENWGKDPNPKLYDMEKDPYESTDLSNKAKKTRAELAKLWNDWNKGNKANIFLQAGKYQKTRLELYKKLYEDLVKEAEKKKTLIVE